MAASKKILSLLHQNRIGLALLLLFWGISIAIYLQLPDIIPTHFNGRGKADDYGPRSTLFTLPLIATVLFTGMAFLKTIPHRLNYLRPVTPLNAARQYRQAVQLLSWLQNVIVLLFASIVAGIYYSVQSGTHHIGKLFLPLSLLFVFAPTIYFLIKQTRKDSHSTN